jgi:hypothetical protein
MTGPLPASQDPPTEKTRASFVWVRGDIWALLSLIVVAVVSTAPFFYAAGGGMPEAHDIRLHWIRMVAFDEGLRAGDACPRWLASLNYGYGAATTSFYAPGIYYALSGAHAITGDWTTAIAVVVILAAAGSVAAFYSYLRCWISTRPAAIAASLYLLLPYRLVDLYHRAALAELLAFVWMPLVLLGLTRAVMHRQVIPVVTASVAFALMLLTHPPTAYLYALSLIVFGVALALVTGKRRALLTTAGALSLGGALSAFYAIPAVAELKYVRQAVVSAFLARPAYLTDLISGARLEQMLGAIAVATLVLSILFYLLARRRPVSLANGEYRAQVIAWLSVAGFCIAMMLPIAAPLIRFMPGYSGIGFLWRWLTIQLFATAALAGFAFDTAVSFGDSSPGRPALRLVMAVSLTAIVLGFGVLASEKASNLSVRFNKSTPAIEEDFTPIWAADIRALSPDGPRAFATGIGARAVVTMWKPQERRIQVTSTNGCEVEVRTFAFPGWEAKVDSISAPIEVNKRMGTIIVTMPPGAHRLRLSFGATPVRRFSSVVSVAAALLCVGCITGVWLIGRVTR